MYRNLLLAGTGGFIGSVMRYLVQILIEKNISGTFPYGTMTANILGSFIIGAVFALSEKGNLIGPEWRIFLAVGVCGGFTTFSAFSYNNFMMIKENSIIPFLLNTGGNLFLGILAVFLGVVFIRTIF
ncbi:MAG: fluoride efflux transporter CrcB [Prolixibacteraceae bacterium]|jgi:CrcB protein|nr:fluoride efflux transporter CrcB [Prolixibacteraceae bacterium]MDD4754746.1 fluoride efflux transporter CrcB [Prolixibacteraceae bacterium]NLO01738.1 fluoride efflux transporter CrcB [Bacteroidales bacterium]